MKKFSGIYPALVTPTRLDHTINVALLRELVELHLREGVNGLWVCGASGEGLSLSEEERRLVATTVTEAMAGRATIIVHVGAVDSLQSARLASHAQECGAHAVASVPPVFYATNEDNIVAHYQRLADSCSLPLFVYHLPGLTHVSLTPQMVEGLLKIPQVRGIKFSDYNLVAMRQIANLERDRLTVLFGMDTMLLAGLMMGADGGVGGTYNYLSGLFVRIYQAYNQGKLSAAQELQGQATDFIFGLNSGNNPISSTKWALSLLGYDCGPPRPPLTGLPAAEQQRMRQFWEKHLGWLERIRTETLQTHEEALVQAQERLE